MPKCVWARQAIEISQVCNISHIQRPTKHLGNFAKFKQKTIGSGIINFSPSMVKYSAPPAEPDSVGPSDEYSSADAGHFETSTVQIDHKLNPKN